MTGPTAGSSGSLRPAEQAEGSVEAPRSAGGNPVGGSPLKRGFLNPVYSTGSPLREGLLGQGQQAAGSGVMGDGSVMDMALRDHAAPSHWSPAHPPMLWTPGMAQPMPDPQEPPPEGGNELGGQDEPPAVMCMSMMAWDEEPGELDGVWEPEETAAQQVQNWIWETSSVPSLVQSSDDEEGDEDGLTTAAAVHALQQEEAGRPVEEEVPWQQSWEALRNILEYRHNVRRQVTEWLGAEPVQGETREHTIGMVGPALDEVVEEERSEGGAPDGDTPETAVEGMSKHASVGDPQGYGVS
mgnify:CR=1 FL=1